MFQIYKIVNLSEHVSLPTTNWNLKYAFLFYVISFNLYLFFKVINSTSKNVEKDDRFIPWSQQVDDAPYESVPSPTEGSQTGQTQF